MPPPSAPGAVIDRRQTGTALGTIAAFPTPCLSVSANGLDAEAMRCTRDYRITGQFTDKFRALWRSAPCCDPPIGEHDEHHRNSLTVRLSGIFGTQPSDVRRWHRNRPD